MVASEVDVFSGTISSSKPTSTHVYCRPVKHNYDKSQVSNELGGYNSRDKNMTSAVKVPSAVVPIDVSRQPLSRMASFRRSLIHVDFLMRRKKKKDKRRNTVTEGDVKELKDAFQKIVTDECHLTLPNSLPAYQQIIADSKNSYNFKVYDDQKNETHSLEQNNNAANGKSPKEDTYTNAIKNQMSHDEKRKNILNSEGLKRELKLNEVENTTRFLSKSKRKGKSHIPISTVSAAMSVAVEMRECNGNRKESPVSNGVYNNDDSLDSDDKIQEDKNSTPICNEEVFRYGNWASYRKRLQDTCSRNGFSERNLMEKDTEVSSSASSENIDPQDAISSAISTESDAFFISSDESEADSSDAVHFKENYGSSTSLGTASNGSLNSLLSETGTEMTSSTETLTSIGHDHILTSPPPPPPMILSATIKDTGIETKISDLTCIENNIEGKKYVKTGAILQKQIKHTKSMKSDILDFQRNITENSKNIFTSLVSLKTHSKVKGKIKNKEMEKKLNKNPHKPAFDMYGHNSPTKTKQVPAFIKENISPLIKNKEKSDMKSFLTNDKSRNSTQFLRNEDTSKSKSDCISHRNVSCTDDQKSSNLIQMRGMQTVGDIPTKYEHQVTVTPVQRYTNVQNKNMCHKESLINENQQQNLKYGSLPKMNFVNKDSQVCIPRNQRPQPPTTLLQQERSKSAARVVLDFDGKVIYTTNSLDRKHCIPGHTINMRNLVKNKVYDPYFKDRQFNNNNCYYNSCQENQVLQNYQEFPDSTYNTTAAYSQGKAIFNNSTLVLTNNTIKENSRSENGHCAKFIPYSDSARQSHVVIRMKSPQSRLSENMQTFVPKRTDLRPFSYAGDSANSYLTNSPSNLFPDPNISGLPVQETMLTKHNINLHSKQMENMNMSAPEATFNRLTDSFSLSPSSFQTNNIDILNKSPQCTMSTDDLFAVIHDCKKRMNIKTDSDISLASSSSRSSSPSYLRHSSSKGTLAETGFLSPRSHAHLENSGDRRSWADFRPVKDSIFPERKSLASDRLGPTKPTSMHDFKMLLLQARTSSQISGPRKSAVEMLKVPLNQSTKNSVTSLPLNASPRDSVSILAQNSLTVELPIYNGHSTVPFKRGNRVRTSLQSRYIMYPPIFEDCSEDLENCGDLISDKSTSDLDTGNTDNKNNSD